MTASQLIKHVSENGCVLIRPRKGERIKGEPWQYDVKDAFGGNKRGWTYLDTTTVSALEAVYNALNEKHKEKFDRLFITTLVDFAWKHVS